MMKNILRLCILLILVIKAQAEPKLNEDQVSRIGAIVLEKANREYRGWFDLKRPEYDNKSKVWRFQLTKEHLPTVIGERIHLFEIRDSDGFVRIGSVDHHGTPEKTDPKFKIPNNTGRFIRKIIQE